MKISEDGDNIICTFDRRLWDFANAVLLKFQCPINYKVKEPNCRRHINQHIYFFVPNGRIDIAEYIVQEWEHEIREADNSESDTHGWMWGTDVSIHYFSGSYLHTEHAEIQKMSQNMMLYLQAKLSGKEADIKDFKTDTKH